MRLTASALCYALGALAMAGVLLLAKPLAAERAGPRASRAFGAGWLPGTYTPRGKRLRRHSLALAAAAVALLACAVAL